MAVALVLAVRVLRPAAAEAPLAAAEAPLAAEGATPVQGASRPRAP